MITVKCLLALLAFGFCLAAIVQPPRVPLWISVLLLAILALMDCFVR